MCRSIVLLLMVISLFKGLTAESNPRSDSQPMVCSLAKKIYNLIEFYSCPWPGPDGDCPTFDVIVCSSISSINIGMFASRTSIIASLAGDRVQSFRVIKQTSRVSLGSTRGRETRLTSRGMARVGRTAMPRFAFNMASNALIVWHS